jgi:hypothetical protein
MDVVTRQCVCGGGIVALNLRQKFSAPRVVVQSIAVAAVLYHGGWLNLEGSRRRLTTTKQ